MKHLKRPVVNDRQLLRQMSTNKSLSSYPELKQYRADVVLAYKAYVRAAASHPASHPRLPTQLTKAMKAHYTSECEPLQFIDTVRNKLSPEVCPTCGAASSSTVDHVLPKTPWPVFAFFSHNLVPACDQCNRKKNDSFFGASPNERPIHPYYDAFLTQRVAIARLVPPYPAPVVEIVPTHGLDADVHETVEWHLENVVRKTSICATLTNRWLALVREPTKVLETLTYGATVQDALQKRLDSHDSSYGTPNNWESMLVAGVLRDADAINYLQRRVAAHALEENPQ